MIRSSTRGVIVCSMRCASSCGVRPAEAEDVDKQAFGEQMAALDRLCGRLTGRGERDLLRRVDLHETIALHPVDGIPDGRGLDVHLLGQPSGDDDATLTGLVVNLHQVILDERRWFLGHGA